MSLSVMTLSSSSSGNAVLVTGNGRSILIDCGIPVKRLKDGLETAGIKLNDVEGILLTHEHDDHIRTAAVVSENYGIPVYGERRTLAAVKARTNLKGGFYFSGRSSPPCFTGLASRRWYISTWHCSMPCRYYKQCRPQSTRLKNLGYGCD